MDASKYCSPKKLVACPITLENMVGIAVVIRKPVKYRSNTTLPYTMLSSDSKYRLQNNNWLVSYIRLKRLKNI